MINGHVISVIMTTYAERYPAARITVKPWLAQPVDELWVLDGGGKLVLDIQDPRLLVFNMPADLGNGMDYAFAPLTRGDFVILADDDVVVEGGFVESLYRGWRKVGNGIVGIRGRIFNSANYSQNVDYRESNFVKEPIRVDFCGVICFAPRKYFGFDLRGLTRNIDDLWWQMKNFPTIPKHVVPTHRYYHLPQAKDGTSMSHNPDLMRQRQEFYETYYKLNYEKKK